MKNTDIILNELVFDSEMIIELEKAQAARSAGNEGMTRVCARRAAGMAARDFLTHHGVRSRRDSAYDSLQKLMAFPGLPPELTQAAAYLILRVNAEFGLPDNIDLISEARKLIGGLSWTSPRR